MTFCIEMIFKNHFTRLISDLNKDHKKLASASPHRAAENKEQFLSAYTSSYFMHLESGFSP